jgi:hypothetical protein
LQLVGVDEGSDAVLGDRVDYVVADLNERLPFEDRSLTPLSARTSSSASATRRPSSPKSLAS